MEYRKRSNLTKRKTVPSEGGRSTRNSPVRFPTLPATLRNRPRDTGETGMARLDRLVRDTPGCRVCGSHTALIYHKVNGKDVYECADHLNDHSTFNARQRMLGEVIAVRAASEVAHMKRYNLKG